MFLMIFVNDASGVKHIPEWIDHAKADADAMGFADTIFPAFLFIVGLSLQFAIKSRIKKGDSTKQLLLYVITRGFALLVMGFYHVNLESYNRSVSLIPKAAWALIITVAFFLIWLDYPEKMKKIVRYALVAAGVLLLVLMAIIYKGGEGTDVHWMRPSWWGILGIIGWSYLTCALIYVLSRGNMKWLTVFYALFVALNIICHTIVPKGKLWIIGDGSSVALVMGGVIISRVFTYLNDAGKTTRLWAVLAVTGVLFIVAGLLIRPYAEGISKIRSTPAWVFICGGITILVFELMIYLMDVKGYRNLLKWISPAGTSTLTCYLLPYFQVFLLMLFNIKYPPVINSGLPGLLRSILTSFILIQIAGWMEKRHLRLKI
ncbi:DUF5009 domain-containing protein [Mucilaginibacter sp. RS28]|uniref:DUF5009 domain-containing protein n=2 Tax=Mucilaginibacter straminoryzae TaxID=2932774 RepID=A0A9X2BC58_9SPHI|nr:DUF5009 domain-containing protein [Mucilaginibacter straminoryzae]